MFMLKRVFGFSVGVFIIAALMGCAGPQTTAKTDTTGGAPAESVYPGFVVIYHPRIQPGMTLESAANDLRTFLKATLPQGTEVLRVADRINTHVGWKVSTTKVYNNSIEISDVTNVVKTLFFYDLLEHKIVVEKRENQNLEYIYLPRSIGLLFMSHKDRYEKVADALYFVQQATRNYRDKLNRQLADFEPIAAQYRSLGIKPEMTENQRRLIVQANALTQQKQYFQAREKYRQAIELDPVSYPGAYFNLALLEAQMNLPFAAIACMKQYLMLVPDARDARSAQDKIYEWELMMPQAFTKEAGTRVSTEPPDAFLEVNVSDSSKPWVYLGRAPKDARIWRTDPKHKFCLIRASKPGYYSEEKSFPFESLPAEIRIQLRKSDSGRDSQGYFGIAYQVVTEEMAKSLGYAEPRGVWVKEVVKDSPAGRAGLEPGDIILTFDGREIKEMIDLPRMTASTPVGKMVNVSIFRNGQKRSCNVKIGKLPD